MKSFTATVALAALATVQAAPATEQISVGAASKQETYSAIGPILIKVDEPGKTSCAKVHDSKYVSFSQKACNFDETENQWYMVSKNGFTGPNTPFALVNRKYVKKTEESGNKPTKHTITEWFHIESNYIKKTSDTSTKFEWLLKNGDSDEPKSSVLGLQRNNAIVRQDREDHRWMWPLFGEEVENKKQIVAVTKDALQKNFPEDVEVGETFSQFYWDASQADELTMYF